MSDIIRLVPNLAWPATLKRNLARTKGQFKHNNLPLSLPAAVDRLQREMDRWNAKDVELNADFLSTRTNKVSLSAPPMGEDPGCILAFQVGETRYVMPIDTFTLLAQNIGGLEAHLAALRAIERYGVQSAVDALGAFVALPPRRDPWAILGITDRKGLEQAEAIYKHRAKIAHPDIEGGSAAAMAELNWAINEIREGRA